MGRITSSIGLVTGIPIQQTVDQLIAIEARPRDLLQARTNKLGEQRTAVADLTARVLAVQFAARQLRDAAAFHRVDVASSRDGLLSATATGSPLPGSYLFTPIQRSQRHQALSSGFASTASPIGGGTLTFRFGGFVDRGLELSLLNGGQGVQRGKIRITDRAGKSAEIDLRFARTIDDVLAAIGGNSAVDVAAEVHGDHIRLVDRSGGSGALRVQEVGLGSTAADLGLAGINVAADSADGLDVVRLDRSLALARLNDGHGVRFDSTLHDLDIALADGSVVEVDFTAEHTTLGDVLDAINAAGSGKLTAELDPDADRLRVTDLTTGAGSLTIENAHASHAASDLALTSDSAAGVVRGGRLLAGLATVLLRSLDGGAGIVALGALDLTNRAGASATIQLDTAETLQDVIDAITGAGISLRARVNDARNGILVEDLSGSTAGNLVIANGDGSTETADRLGLTVNAAQSAIDGGDLNLRLVSENTLLSALNGGAGVGLGRIRLTDSLGGTNSLVLDPDNVRTVGDVIDAINALAVGISARINDEGSGILLVDEAGGPSQIRVEDLSGTTARDLRIAGTGMTIDLVGTPTSVLDGAMKIRVEFDADDTVADAVAKINDLGGGVTATLVNDGTSGAPIRMSLSSDRSGAAGALGFDATQVAFTLRDSARAQDALLLFGGAADAATGLLAASPTDRFDQLVEGLRIQVNGSTLDPVALEITRSDAALVARVQTLVDAYNALDARLDAYTSIDLETFATGPLYNSIETRRVRQDLSQLLGGRFGDGGAFRTLSSVGIELASDGTLSLDAAKLKEAFAADPESVERLFTAEALGVAARLDAVAETLVGPDRSLLLTSAATLAAKIAANTERIAALSARLARSRERLFGEFTRLESTIARIQSDLSAVTAIQALLPISGLTGRTS